jgi:hypothetical protein
VLTRGILAKEVAVNQKSPFFINEPRLVSTGVDRHDGKIEEILLETIFH